MHRLTLLLALATAGGAFASEMPACPQFSMSFKVTALNGELATAAGREKALKWLKANEIGKVWLETYRHNEYVPTERLTEMRDFFRGQGFEVCGLITYTMLNDPKEPGGEREFVNCWSDPKARERTRAEAVRAAKVFDVLLLDDFMFTQCTCERCDADKRVRQYDWGGYRRYLITDVLENLIRKPAEEVNPKVRVIVKYQCWYDGWFESGDDPAVQAAKLGACWIGTETRDLCPDALKACWINDFIAALTDGKCAGAWYDPLDCAPAKFVEQARYTILGGAKESLLHCWDYLVSDTPGLIPFGQKARQGHGCLEAYERARASLVALAKRLAGARRGNYWMQDGVSTHEFFRGGRRITVTMDTQRGTCTLAESAGEAPTAEDFRRATLALPTGQSAADRQYGEDLRFLQRTLPDPSLIFNLEITAAGGVLTPKLPRKAMEMVIWSCRR